MLVNIENTNEILKYGKREQNKLSRLSSDVLNNAKINYLNDMDKIIIDLITVFDGPTKNKRFKFKKSNINDIESQIMELIGKLEVSYLNVLNNVFDMQNLFNEIVIINDELKRKIYEGNQFIKNKNNDNIERFKNVLHSLEISTVVATQMMTQIQTIITSDKILVRKIKFTIQNTIPIWRATNDSDLVVKELIAALNDCQNNIKEHEKLQLNPQT